MTKHTEEPWEYFEQKTWGKDDTYGCVRQISTGLVIMNGCAPGGTDEQKANARLFATAPELLSVCEILLKIVRPHGNAEITHLRDLAKAAIAKADLPQSGADPKTGESE